MSETLTLDISGMTCMHCVAAVEKALTAVSGVDEVSAVVLEPGSATVIGTAPAEALIAAVREAGYEASISS